ncbi:MAG: hypothetical protein HYZ49_01195 [Chloroflexi bacterium]|nr:hypothetical protein [Chloroflexota bacterium]
MSKKLFLQILVLTLTCAVALAAAAPQASANMAAALPTLPTRGAGGSNVAATAGAASTKIAATAAAAATKAGTVSAIKATVTPPATVSSGDASKAITSYASTVLGINVTVKKAGGLTGDVNKLLTQTTSGGAAQSATAKLAVKSYGAVLSNGAASLSYGSGTISGDVNVDVQGSSLGVYSLAVSNTGTLNADSALTLAKNTFPGIADRKYTAYTVTKGYAWYFKGTASGLDPKTKKVVTLAEAIILYVLPGASGKASV